MDELSYKLQASQCGCCIGKQCLNHLFYADDCVLLAPTPASLQQLINICELYASTNEILFNAKKTEIIALNRNVHQLNLPSIFLNGLKLDWKSSIKYLGVHIMDNMCDSMDMRRQMKYLYCTGNGIIRNFKHCSYPVKWELFRTLCTNMYSCHLWCNYQKAHFNQIRVAYNDVFRMLMSIPRGSSISQFFMMFNMPDFYAVLRNAAYRFLQRLLSSSNQIVCEIVRRGVFIYSSQTMESICSLLM